MASNQISLSDDGIKFITQPQFDSFVAKPYIDSGGLWTIGFGTRITDDLVVKYKDGITEDFAWTLFKAHNALLLSQLQKCPLAGLQQWQNDAIFSLSYNIGIEAFINSTIYKVLMTRGTDLSPWKWFIYDQNKQKQQGLVRRREMEVRLFIWGLYN